MTDLAWEGGAWAEGRAWAEAGPIIGATFAALVQKPFLPAKEEASTDVLGGHVGNCASQK